LPYFPLFIDLTGSPCVLIGGGHVAERRAKTLLEFGARTRVIAPEASAAILALARDGLISLEKREYAGSEDIGGAVLVITATNDRELNRRIARDAGEAGIPVNTADDPESCSFFFPALVRRGELVAGISTSGSCPGLAARLRKELEEMWPDDWGKALEALAAERRRLMKTAGRREQGRNALKALIAKFPRYL
jgi:siroheme synthase-like protein